MKTTKWIAASAAVLALGGATGAKAGIYTDDLSRCLVSKTTDQDKTQLVRWIFSAVSRNPAVKDLVTLSDAQRQQSTKAVAELFQRLLLDDCHKQTVDALKYEGPVAATQSFQVLGQVAARGLMSDPAVTKDVQSLTSYVDKPRWQALAKEAGVNVDLTK